MLTPLMVGELHDERCPFQGNEPHHFRGSSAVDHPRVWVHVLVVRPCVPRERRYETDEAFEGAEAREDVDPFVLQSHMIDHIFGRHVN